MALESIALIPSGYKATKVYSQLPVDGGGDFTFDRGTSATQTRVNKNGLIEDVAQDVPRLDYLDGGCPSLLLEPASTNLITYSDDFSDASWSKLSGATIVVDQVLSPDGSINADLLQGDGIGANSIYVTQSVSIGVSYALSVFAKKADYDLFNLYNFTQIGSVTFDLSNGTISTPSSGTFSDEKIEDYGNGWYRCSVVFTATATASNLIGFQNNTISGNLSYIFGAQLEQKSYATSYMPSLSGVSGVRDAETCNGAGTTDEINSQEGVLFGEFRALADDLTYREISLSDGTTNNRLEIRYDLSGPNRIQFLFRVGGVIQVNKSIELIDITKYHNFAFKYKENDFAFYINGLLVDVDVSGSVPSSGTFNELAFDGGGGALPFYGRVKKLKVYDQALSTTELETLTGFNSFAEMSSYLSYS